VNCSVGNQTETVKNKKLLVNPSQAATIMPVLGRRVLVGTLAASNIGQSRAFIY